MPCWYFDKSDLKKTASILDGLTPETEARYRREGPRYIFDMGTKLGLHHDTIATAIVFFHRFYVFHSFKKFPRYITATCCLFLAGKVEETPKKCKDLVKVARSLLNDAQFSQFGEDPKEEVMTFERMLLQTIKFDLMVEHPYKYMLQYAKALKGDREKVEKLVQMAFTFINDSLCTSLSLQWEPQIVAVAVMYLAGRLCKFEPQDWAYNRGRWWDQFIDDISTDLLEDICHQILDLYSSQKVGKSTASKTKRERPKTPQDADKSIEPQAKTSRHDQHAKSSKSKSQSSSQSSNPSASQSKSSSSVNQAVNRRNSSNTEVVAMDMEETETDSNIIIEQNRPIPTTTPIKLEKQKSVSSIRSGTYYDNVNQYQSFIGAPVEPTSLPQPPYTTQHSGTYSQPHTPNAPVPPPVAPPTHYGPAPPNSKYPHQFLQQTSVPPPTFPGYHDQRYPPQPPNFGGGFPVPPPTSGTPTGLATVRITGRRDQQNQW